MSSPTIPFLDLKAHHDPIRAEIMTALHEVIDRSAFAGGPYVARFEEAFAPYCEAGFCAGVSNGTDALYLALVALGIGRGDEVVTAPMTFMATAEAITRTGAKPIFVDIEPRTYTMDVAKLEAALTPFTRAIIPVHLFGQSADMDSVMSIAKKNKLFVIEDAAQAAGARYKGRKVGALGHAGAFSFYPGKNLGAWGEAGAVVTNDAAVYERVKMLRDHGQKTKYHHDVVGWNARMDGLQGAVLNVKLKYLDQANARRNRVAELYRDLLADATGVALPVEADYARHVYHVFAVRVNRRERLIQQLGERGIGTGIHYPVPVHLQRAYGDLGHKRGDFPVSEACADSFLSLPMYPELTEEQVQTVAREFNACVNTGDAVTM